MSGRLPPAGAGRGSRGGGLARYWAAGCTGPVRGHLGRTASWEAVVRAWACSGRSGPVPSGAGGMRGVRVEGRLEMVALGETARAIGVPLLRGSARREPLRQAPREVFDGVRSCSRRREVRRGWLKVARHGSGCSNAENDGRQQPHSSGDLSKRNCQSFRPAASLHGPGRSASKSAQFRSMPRKRWCPLNSW